MTLNDLLKSVLVVLSFSLALSGCASRGTLAAEESTNFMERLQIETKGGVRVSTTVLSAIESEEVYGVPLADKGIQPVWVEVENNDIKTVDYRLMSLGMDPYYIPASEAADAFAGTDHQVNREQTQRFEKLAFKNPIPAGSTVSGFVLTNLDEGIKMVEVDLVASGHLRTFSFLIDVPGFRADYTSKPRLETMQYAPEGIINYTDDAEFRAALEALPCCATNRKGSRNGDPLNLVFIGNRDDAFPALVRRGWSLTEATYAGSVMKMINSAMAQERYLYAPISPLYLFGRPQDIALQKARDNVHQRNHLRLWISPMQYHGRPVWIGQISRDIGTRFTIHSPYLTTHKIDPDVDEALNSLLQDLAYSQYLARIGLVNGVGAASRDAPRKNLTTDPYYTAGYRGVLFFADRPTGLADIEILPWERRTGGFIEAAGRKPSP